LSEGIRIFHIVSDIYAATLIKTKKGGQDIDN